MQGLDDAVVVDATSRMLLVDGGGPTLQRLVDDLPGWIMAPEQSQPLPDTRAKVERPPPE